MKKILLFGIMAAALGLTACSSDDDNEENMGGGSMKRYFIATREEIEIDTPDSADKCKTWEIGDEIVIMSDDGKGNTSWANYKALESDATAVFAAATPGNDVCEYDDYEAWYPASLWDGEKIVMPAEISETWEEGLIKNMPMLAVSTTNEFQFQNLCGVLKIIVKNDQLATVKRIRVSSPSAPLSGTVQRTNDGLGVDDEMIIDIGDIYGYVAANSLTVTYTNAVETDAKGKAFYIAVPPEIYVTLNIELDPDGNGFTKCMTIYDGYVLIERNQINTITFADNLAPGSRGTAKAKIGDSEVDVNWIQLWPGGPKFAEFNLGASKPNEYGGWYEWSETGETDVAATSWGPKWRVPTLDMLNELIWAASPSDRSDKVSFRLGQKDGIVGCIFNGKEQGYMGNYLVLPAQDVEDTFCEATYWSGTPSGDEEGIAVQWNYDGGNYNIEGWGHYREEWLYVRPVLAE